MGGSVSAGLGLIGGRVASSMRTQTVLDASEMARWARGTRLEGLIAHADAGSQFTILTARSRSSAGYLPYDGRPRRTRRCESAEPSA